MKRSHGLVIAASLGLGGLYGLYHAVRATPEHEPDVAKHAAGDPAELAELRREVAHLRVEMWNQRDRPPLPGRDHAPQDPATAKDRRADPEARAESERRYQAYVAGLETAFRSEPTDPRWSAATSSVVHRALAEDAALRSRAREVECRSRTCRVELADAGSGDLSKVIPMFTQRVGQALPTATTNRIEDRGETRLVLYLTRPD
jgi:hypothetical protein